MFEQDICLETTTDQSVTDRRREGIQLNCEQFFFFIARSRLQAWRPHQDAKKLQMMS